MTNITIPIQKKMLNSVDSIPIEIFIWGKYPDHFIIEKPHRHNFEELLFFTKGGGTHEIEFKDYKIEQHSIHFVPRSSVHCVKKDLNSEGFTLAFDNNFLECNNIHTFNNPIYNHQLNNNEFVLNLNKSQFYIIIQLFDILQEQIKKSNGYYKEKCFLLSLELVLNSIASEVLDNNSKQVIEKAQNPTFLKFKKLVKNNIYQNTSVLWYAKKLHISPNYLGNLVRMKLDISPKQFIIYTLLSSVKKRLLDTKQSIKQIAFEHNIDVSRLGKLFKKNVGNTMSKFRSIENVEL